MKLAFLKSFVAFLLFSIFSLVTFAQVESEPNNSFVTANNFQLNNFNVNIQGSIPTNGDKDYYTIQIPQAGVFRLNVTNVDPNISINLALFDSGQNEIDDDSGNSGEPVSLNSLVCEAGIYYIRIQEVGNNDSGPDTYNLAVFFDTSDIYECNEQFTTASTVQINQSIEASIGSQRDEDFYKVEITQPGVFVINVTNINQNIDMDVTLFDIGQNQIANRDSNDGAPVTLVEKVCEAGIYYIRLKNDASTFSANLYNLNISLNTDDIYECNEEFLTASNIQLGETLKAQIYPINDEDFYSFEITQPGVIELSVFDIPSNLYIKVEIYNTNEEQIAFKRVPSGGAIYVNRLVCETGTYYLRIEDNNNNSNELLYTFSVNLNTSDQQECNNSFETATPIQICSSTNATFYSSSDLDYYSFEGIANETVQIEILDVPMNIYPRIIIYDAAQNQVASSSSSLGVSLSKEFTPTSTGLHFIKAYDNGNDESSQLYRFILFNETCPLLGINEIDSESLDIYPNPSQNELFINVINAEIANGLITVYDLAGKELHSSIANLGVNKINIEEFPQGLFLVKFTAGDKTSVRKIIKE